MNAFRKRIGGFAWATALIAAVLGTSLAARADQTVQTDHCRLTVNTSTSYYGFFGIQVDPTGTQNFSGGNLTFATNGGTNGMALKVDGTFLLPGIGPGTQPVALDNDTIVVGWSYPQSSGPVDLAALYEVVDVGNGQRDTVKASFTVTNNDSVAHTVGFKLGLDTQIANNDSARIATSTNEVLAVETGFGVDGVGGTYPNAIVPAQFFAFQNNDIGNPGLIGRVSFGPGVGFPDKLVMGNWSAVSASANFNYQPTGNTYGDSAYAAWWLDRTLQPGQSQTFIFYYGMASAVSSGGFLAMNVVVPRTAGLGGGVVTPNPVNGQVTIQNTTAQVITNVVLEFDLPTPLALTASTLRRTVGGPNQVELGNFAPGEVKTFAFGVLVDAGLVNIDDVLDWSVTALGTYGSDPTQTVAVLSLRIVEGTGSDSLILLVYPGQWNLLSLPFAPLDPAIASMFGEVAIAYVWDAEEQTYVQATAIAGGEGFFLWVPLEEGEELGDDRALLVLGAAPAGPRGHLLAERWNLVGPGRQAVLPEDPAMVATFGFDPLTQRYTFTGFPGFGQWLPGAGYFLFTTDAVEAEF